MLLLVVYSFTGQFMHVNPAESHLKNALSLLKCLRRVLGSSGTRVNFPCVNLHLRIKNEVKAGTSEPLVTLGLATWRWGLMCAVCSCYCKDDTSKYAHFLCCWVLLLFKIISNYQLCIYKQYFPFISHILLDIFFSDSSGLFCFLTWCWMTLIILERMLCGVLN